MDAVFWSRILTAETLSFHIIFATIGVGVPLFISLAEAWGIWKKDNHYIMLAKRWTRGFVITVAVGVVTGTCIGLMLSLLWPQFMQLAGNVISLPLFMETFAFFVEAIFLGIYLYTWDRFKNPWIHWASSVPIVIGSSMSAVFITIVNAFMNTPAGFRLENGKAVDIDPIAAMLNPATPSKVAHVLSSAYLTCGFLLASIAAYHILKGRNHVYYKKALRLTMITGFILAIATFAAGDISGKFLAKHQPTKLAAAEWHFETAKQAPLIFGGVLNKETQEVKYGIEIPFALSILAGNSPNHEVKGLNDIPQDLWPPLYIHYLFDGMVSIGFYLLLVSAVFAIEWYRKKGNQWSPWLLRGIVLGAPLAFIAIQLGWIFAEVGRQPWIITGVLRVDKAATTADHVSSTTWAFSALFLALGILTCIVLYRLFRHNRAEQELAKRYGL
ncbi:cytochrome bd-I ubiquinol oxidase subunit 1 apoprotein [Thermoactinomyces sp. DSM 45891]|uniref:cytochrome ubiquinol oxidase subunit I n=1 Tax=Thermoactinomyces sp. DSM 45891 TaxID=1761907 RepID=UPI00092100E7|nr:cytochrome ubiquinol oxidase subunit I [Thermoactinomyces sp. DSM 45891]SFX28344.1 cytochrome bd-I ubiquinol oxidase subunit 1 apoprotein [Thermoactinomyces sp. DSM 45891]